MVALMDSTGVLADAADTSPACSSVEGFSAVVAIPARARRSNKSACRYGGPGGCITTLDGPSRLFAIAAPNTEDNVLAWTRQAPIRTADG
ncbi:MAG: hypothetical protein ACLRXC_11090 [[Clostridium] leptum]